MGLERCGFPLWTHPDPPPRLIILWGAFFVNQVGYITLPLQISFMMSHEQNKGKRAPRLLRNDRYMPTRGIEPRILQLWICFYGAEWIVCAPLLKIAVCSCGVPLLVLWQAGNFGGREG